ncbi:MAG: hypothetical protein HOW73_22825 [Polyangiaceae bacterium]|nr:hypothetical protein [Polyangiaceae bacterium]
MSARRAWRRRGTLLLSAAFALATATASAGGPIGTEPGDLPNGGYFTDADTCANCHKAAGSMDRDYMPSDTWGGTMMANATRDPVFLAGLAIANQDEPGVGSFCLRCHSPIAFVRGHATPPDATAFDAIDHQGIGCDTCHRAETSNPADPTASYAIGNAQLRYSDDSSMTKHGPYADSSSPAHSTMHDPQLSSSRFCGQCHQVSNPSRRLKDASGADTLFDFPLDTTYEEWANSDYADGRRGTRGCIDCHMQKKLGEWPVTKTVGSPLRTDPRDHGFVGGNHWGIRAVMEANPDRVALHGPAFDLALERTLANLETAVDVTLLDAPVSISANVEFEVTVRVENLTGHKFPTGYAESRRAWISLVLVDADGAQHVLTGGYEPATGAIQQEPPTHVYQAVHGRWDAPSRAASRDEHLVLHDSIVSDTRIPPLGFGPSAITMPTGEIAFQDSTGAWTNIDEATFTVVAPPGLAAAGYTLEARIQYQSMTRDYIEFLRDENGTNDAGEVLSSIYESTDEAPPIVIASAQTSIEVASEGGAGAGGGDPASGGSGEGGASTPGDGENGGDGCTCGVVPNPSSPQWPAALALAALVFARRRSFRLKAAAPHAGSS